MSRAVRHEPRGPLGVASVAMLLCWAASLQAQQVVDAGVAPATPSSTSSAVSPQPPATDTGACIEHLPSGRARPAMSESFPSKLLAGYGGVLRLSIEHGKGESVLPGGIDLKLSTPEGRVLKRSGFVLASVDGPQAPRVEREETEAGVTTTVELTFVPLPEEAGPHTLMLPPVPIAIARASGDLTTVCTRSHVVDVQDPTSNVVQAKPRTNPAPERQLEVWTLAKTLALGALVALPLGALIALAVAYWLRRPRPAPPPPPPRPPWESALEALARLRRQGLLERGETREHFAQVSLAVREYLGRRYGFDGLESTTREMLACLAVARPGAEIESEICDFLERADLVKFANLRPEVAECESALERGEKIVRTTMQRPQVPPTDLDRELSSAVERSEERALDSGPSRGGSA